MLEQIRTNGAQNGSVSVTAHEFHNLISVIIAEAQLLQLHYPAHDPNYQSAVAIERAGRRLEALVDRLTPLRDTVAVPNRKRRDEAVPQNAESRPHRVIEQVTDGAEA
jgi:nitrogen-specific signal transduction histidine kinase